MRQCSVSIESFNKRMFCPFPGSEASGTFTRSQPAYFRARPRTAIGLSRPGTVIVGDNVVRGGGISDSQSHDANVVGVRRFVEDIGRHPRLVATGLQTVGMKGYDGFALALVLPLRKSNAAVCR